MRLVFIGPPGAGKGTQAKLLCDRYRIAHISTGDMLRDSIAAGTATGQKARPYLERGDLVPDHIIVEMVSERLDGADAAAGFLLDGFPRTVAQAAALDNVLEPQGRGLDAVIFLDVDQDELVRRLGDRWICSNTNCGAAYNMATRAPRAAGTCDRCGSALLQRNDDRPETILKRFHEYQQKTAAVVEYFSSKGILKTVPGKGTVEQIQRRIRDAVGNREA